MRLFDWFKKPKVMKQPHPRAKGTKKTFKLVGLDICLRWIRCRGCGGEPILIQGEVDEIDINCPNCGQRSRLIIVPFDYEQENKDENKI